MAVCRANTTAFLSISLAFSINRTTMCRLTPLNRPIAANKRHEPKKSDAPRNNRKQKQKKKKKKIKRQKNKTTRHRRRYWFAFACASRINRLIGKESQRPTHIRPTQPLLSATPHTNQHRANTHKISIQAQRQKLERNANTHTPQCATKKHTIIVNTSQQDQQNNATHTCVLLGW